MKHFVWFPTFVLFFYFSFLNKTHNENNYLPNDQAGIACQTSMQANESICASKLQCSFPSFQHLAKDLIKEDSKGIEAKGINQDLYSNVLENIKAEEYNISYSGDLKSYQSPNRANNIRFIFHNDGFTAKTRENRIPLFDLNDKTIQEEDKKYKKISEWSIDFKIKGLSKVENESILAQNDKEGIKGIKNFVEFSGDEIKVDRNKASIEDNNMKIDYTNSEKGMRQDFVIKNKPNGEGNLRLELSAETQLKMVSSADALLFKDKNGNEKMKYSALKVWDNEGRKLEAYFEPKSKIKNEKSKIQSFAIVVNDEDAIYPITIDPLSTSPEWTAEGDQANPAFGFSVSTAGDVNSDGYSDVIIGSPFYDNGETDEGRAYVFLGSAAGLLPDANWIGEGNQIKAQFGFSVSCAGDVNGDGYADVIVGANVYDNDQTDEGRAYVYYGSSTGLSSFPNWTAESDQSQSQYAWSVSTAGDVNDDGYSDVIVGAPLYNNQQEHEGGAFVYYGSAQGLPPTANKIVESNQATAFFGISVSTAGDINGDGYSDVIVGANAYDNPLRDEGAAFIYYGSVSGLSSTPNWTSESHPLAFFAYYGISVSTAGDVNADGYSDVIVGAYAYDNGETDEGRVFVYHGSAAGLPSAANWIAESNQQHARFGNSVSTAGDVNGDGYSDVIVGASEYENGEANEGNAFVYYGSATGLSPVVNWTVESNQANAYYGVSVSTAGNVNGDAFSDVIVGAYLYDNVQGDGGSVFVYHGSGSGAKILSLKVLIQGLYNPNTNLMVRDTVKVYLRNTSAPYVIVDSAKAYLSPFGTGTFEFNNVSNGVNYYLQIKHRNSIETWSATGQSFINNSLNYDFSTSSTQAFGDNMRLVDTSPLRLAIYSGDVNQDGSIDASDISLVANDGFNSISGYVKTDLNGDNFVDCSDLSIVDNNITIFVSKITP